MACWVRTDLSEVWESKRHGLKKRKYAKPMKRANPSRVPMTIPAFAPAVRDEGAVFEEAN